MDSGWDGGEPDGNVSLSWFFETVLVFFCIFFYFFLWFVVSGYVPVVDTWGWVEHSWFSSVCVSFYLMPDTVVYTDCEAASVDDSFVVVYE